MTGEGHSYLKAVVLVGVGGFAGAGLRYAVSASLASPLGTLAVNVVGSFLLGVVMYESIHIGFVSRESRYVVSTGFLSSLTTYSTFGVETFTQPTVTYTVANFGANYVLGLTAVYLGRELILRTTRCDR
ncbi:MAG: fluoride efflux transporter CrcB [Halobacteria archaeon]|nr:fluoride efflux transporter CrcB [Halobacteria archaeon]